MNLGMKIVVPLAILGASAGCVAACVATGGIAPLVAGVALAVFALGSMGAGYCTQKNATLKEYAIKTVQLSVVVTGMLIYEFIAACVRACAYALMGSLLDD